MSTPIEPPYDKPRCAVAATYGTDVWERALEIVGDPREVYLKGPDWWDRFAVDQGYGFLDAQGEFTRTPKEDSE